MRKGMKYFAIFALVVSALILFESSTFPKHESSHQRTVPALWASSVDSSSGVEYATINIASDGKPGFSIDLTTELAQGAGTSWRAASAQAAVTAAFFSMNAPAGLSVSYSVSAPIDGPSAGAILTVGTLAALRGDSLKPNVTMTGTISPDGRIGMVGLIDRKIEGARKAGFEVVLIPTGGLHANTSIPDGIKVIEVGDIAEAYEYFTGAKIFPQVATPEINPNLLALAKEQSTMLAGMPEMVQSRQFLYDQAIQMSSQKPLQEDEIIHRGHEAYLAARQLVDDTLTEQALTQISSSQRAALTSALAPALKAGALAESGARWAEKYPGTSSALEALSSIIYSAELNISRLSPALITVAMANVPSARSDNTIAIDDLEGYTDFLLPAAEANHEYLNSVLSQSEHEMSIDPLLAARVTSSEILNEIPVTQGSATMSEALKNNTYAIAKWASSAQSIGLLDGRSAQEKPSSISKELIYQLGLKSIYEGSDASWAEWIGTWCSEDFESGLLTAVAVASAGLISTS